MHKVLNLAEEKGYPEKCAMSPDGFINSHDYLKWMAFFRMWLRKEHKIHFEVKAPDQVQKEWYGHIWRIGKFGALGDAKPDVDYTIFIDNLAIEALKLI